MTVRSRTIVLSVPVNEIEQYYFRIRGITNISFALDTKVGTAQGIAANFVHPWFIGPVDVRLQGSSYIGTFHNVQDEVLDETTLPDLTGSRPRSLGEIFKSMGSGILSATVGRFKLLSKKKEVAESTAQKPSFTYQKTQQLTYFINTLYRISEKVRKGTIQRSGNEIVKQQLTIYDYRGPGQNLVFDGFISDISITEEQERLGVIKFTITFRGILSPISTDTIAAQGSQR